MQPSWSGLWRFLDLPGKLLILLPFVTAHSDQGSMEPTTCDFDFCQWFGLLHFFWCSMRSRWDTGKWSSHHHGRGENSVPASLEPVQQVAVSCGSCTQQLQEQRAQGWLPAAVPVPCSCTHSMPADFTQLLMIPASSLRTSVTDGGSAGLCPLGKTQQCQLLDSGFAFCTQQSLRF